jgi:hypothetical protein
VPGGPVVAVLLLLPTIAISVVCLVYTSMLINLLTLGVFVFFSLIYIIMVAIKERKLEAHHFFAVKPKSQYQTIQ